MGEEIERPRITLKKNEKAALREVSRIIRRPMKAEEIQEELFGAARKFGVEIPRFFQIFYNQVLGIDRGPRAGNLIEIIGRKRVARILEKV